MDVRVHMANGDFLPTVSLIDAFVLATQNQGVQYIIVTFNVEKKQIVFERKDGLWVFDVLNTPAHPDQGALNVEA